MMEPTKPVSPNGDTSEIKSSGAKNFYPKNSQFERTPEKDYFVQSAKPEVEVEVEVEPEPPEVPEQPEVPDEPEPEPDWDYDPMEPLYACPEDM